MAISLLTMQMGMCVSILEAPKKFTQCFCSSCGRGLKALYSSPVLQNFINHVPMKESYCEKRIYQPGALRKVHNYYLVFHLTLVMLFFFSVQSTLQFHSDHLS